MDPITKRMNATCFDQIMLCPRIMTDVTEINTEQTISGCQSSVPFYFSPVAMAKLIHPEDKKAVARGFQRDTAIQTISTQASCPVNDIVQRAGSPGQPFFLQLYVNRYPRKRMFKHVQAWSIKAIFVAIRTLERRFVTSFWVRYLGGF